MVTRCVLILLLGLCSLTIFGEVQIDIAKSKLCKKKRILWEEPIWWCETFLLVKNTSKDTLCVLTHHQLNISPFFEENKINRRNGEIDFMMIDSSKKEVVEACGLRVLSEEYYFDRRGRIHKISYDCSNPDTKSYELFSQKKRKVYVKPQIRKLPPNESLNLRVYCLIGEIDPKIISQLYAIRIYWNILEKVHLVDHVLSVD